MGTFELIPSRKDPKLRKLSVQERLGSAALLRDARWFIKLRWVVVAVLIGVGLTGILFPGIMRNLGLVPPISWPWILAGILISANIVFYILVYRLKENSPRQRIVSNIWFQIGVDLMVIMFLVHKVGSTDTFVAFIYLFHIVLACIFFPVRGSLLVTFFAVVLYFVSVVLEITGVWSTAGIVASNLRGFPKNSSLSLIFAGCAVFVWFVVWYLGSTLSKAVRTHARQLSEANEQLLKADQEKTKQVITTTHELRTPFAGIESNIQVLKYQYWNDIPDSVHSIINRIENGAQMLSDRIRSILILGDLRSPQSQKVQFVPVDLRSVMDAVVEEIDEKVKSRRISLDINIPTVQVLGNMKQLKILFSNIMENAILYSYEGGSVKVSAKQDGGEVRISVSDQGIGIRVDALSRIFDDYFRTKEAARFNRMSTGIGLAIVKEIAQKFGFRINITSEREKGTIFEVIIPKIKTDKY